MRHRQLFTGLFLGGLLGIVPAAQALTVSVGGVSRSLEELGATCLDLTGDYGSVRIEGSRLGKKPYVCFHSRRQISLSLRDMAIISTDPSAGEVTMEFEHEFRDGPEGKVYGRVRLQGFFAKGSGVGPAAGDGLLFYGVVDQGGNEDLIGEKLEADVSDDAASAVVDLKTRDNYITAGRRTLRGSLAIRFKDVGDKLVLNERTAILMENVKRFSDIVDDESF